MNLVFINIIVLVSDKNTQFLLFFFKEKEKVRRKKVYIKNIKFEKGKTRLKSKLKSIHKVYGILKKELRNIVLLVLVVCLLMINLFF